MKKNLLLYILLAFLVIMNCFFLFKHFSTTDAKTPKRQGPSDFIAKELEFDAKQSQQFEKLDAAHRENMSLIFDDIRQSKDVLFDKLSDDMTQASEIDSIASLIADIEVKKELEIFRFFKSVREVCTAEQKERFNTIIKDGLRQQGQGGRSPKGPPRGGPRDGNRPPPPPIGH